jgi:hypothetical protein
MKKRSEESSLKPVAPADLRSPPKSHVRYLGFESIDGGRRLRFRVKSNNHERQEVTFDIADAQFIATSGISIQDAAPMAYEKLVELLSTQDPLNDRLCLTDVDIARYLNRHLSSQKRAYSLTDGRRGSDVAA